MIVIPADRAALGSDLDLLKGGHFHDCRREGRPQDAQDTPVANSQPRCGARLTQDGRHGISGVTSWQGYKPVCFFHSLELQVAPENPS